MFVVPHEDIIKHLYNQLKRIAHCFPFTHTHSLSQSPVSLIRRLFDMQCISFLPGISIVPKSAIILINFCIYKHHIKHTFVGEGSLFLLLYK